jgi:hypothetical protein
MEAVHFDQLSATLGLYTGFGDANMSSRYVQIVRLLPLNPPKPLSLFHTFFRLGSEV